MPTADVGVWRTQFGAAITPLEGTHMPAPQRWMMYVDGFNFYYAIKHSRGKFPIHLGWCNFARLGERIIGDRGTLVGVQYFTAPVAEYGEAGGPLGGEAQRQSVWLHAVRTIPKLRIVQGFHTGDRNADASARRKTRSEKQTDVNIAVSLVRDAARDEYDSAILVSGDADQVPTVRCVTKDFRKELEVWLPPGHGLGRWKEMQRIRHVRIGTITSDMLAECRLAEIVPNRGAALRIPDAWRAPASENAT